MCCLQVVAGALVEGDDDEATSPTGNAASWIKVQLMLEEVSTAGGPPTPSPQQCRNGGGSTTLIVPHRAMRDTVPQTGIL